MVIRIVCVIGVVPILVVGGRRCVGIVGISFATVGVIGSRSGIRIVWIIGGRRCVRIVRFLLATVGVIGVVRVRGFSRVRIIAVGPVIIIVVIIIIVIVVVVVILGFCFRFRFRKYCGCQQEQAGRGGQRQPPYGVG